MINALNENINIIGGYSYKLNNTEFEDQTKTYSLLLFDISKTNTNTSETYFIQENFNKTPIKPNVISYINDLSCEKSYNTNYNLSISNCSLSIISNSSIDYFDLINLSYTNTTQYIFVEPSYSNLLNNTGSNFLVLPKKLQSNFTFIQCPNQECLSFNQIDYFNTNQFFFKLTTEYEIFSANLLESNSKGEILYFREVTDLLSLSKGVYSLKMTKFPNEFDLILNMKTNSTGINTVVTVILKGLKVEYPFSEMTNPNLFAFMIGLGLIFIINLVTISLSFMKVIMRFLMKNQI